MLQLNCFYLSISECLFAKMFVVFSFVDTKLLALCNINSETTSISFDLLCSASFFIMSVSFSGELLLNFRCLFFTQTHTAGCFVSLLRSLVYRAQHLCCCGAL